MGDNGGRTGEEGRGKGIGTYMVNAKRRFYIVRDTVLVGDNLDTGLLWPVFIWQDAARLCLCEDWLIDPDRWIGLSGKSRGEFLPGHWIVMAFCSGIYTFCFMTFDCVDCKRVVEVSHTWANAVRISWTDLSCTSSK